MAEGILRQWFDPQAVEIPVEFQSSIGGSQLASEILLRRGFDTQEKALPFLNPDLYQPAPPESLPGIEKACERIERAIQNGEKICVWGDFDVDGQTSTTLLVSAFRRLYGEDNERLVQFHIPVRSKESHGVNWEYLEPILNSGVTLVITCDTGISSIEALEEAARRGVDVIITDHHDPPDQLPRVLAAINPKLTKGDHPLSGLPGVGVAFMVVKALFIRAGLTQEIDSYLDLVALGIVADLAEQKDDTRWLLQRGLPILREARRLGIAMMLELCDIVPNNLTEEHIGFGIGPRLNALGRLDDANSAVEFLTTTDPARARVLATHLEGLNARRRLLTEQVISGALAQIEKDPSLLEQAVLVLAHPEWHAGVIGIVASELSERYNRPTILISCPPGQLARGSARSVEGVHITEAIESQKELLDGFGGHPMAAGLSLDPDRIPAFRRGISRYVENVMGGVNQRLSLWIDGWVALNELDLNLVADLERLAPFGPGNPAPVLGIKNLSILSSSAIGRDADHLQIVIKDEDDNSRRVIWWRGAGWPLPEGAFDLACTIRASNYRGQREVQIEWVDARPVDNSEVALRRATLVIDQRDIEHPLPVLQQITAETAASVWGEAESVEPLSAQNRFQLAPADTLIIWTTPPGQAELEAVISQAQPTTIVLFAVDPKAATVETFLQRLAGLVKYTLEHRSGEVSLDALAAATAQRETSVLLGLKWLDQRGIAHFEKTAESTIRLTIGNKVTHPESDATLAQLRTLLKEVAEYRKFFHSANKDTLFT